MDLRLRTRLALGHLLSQWVCRRTEQVIKSKSTLVRAVAWKLLSNSRNRCERFRPNRAWGKTSTVVFYRSDEISGPSATCLDLFLSSRSLRHYVSRFANQHWSAACARTQVVFVHSCRLPCVLTSAHHFNNSQWACPYPHPRNPCDPSTN